MSPLLSNKVAVVTGASKGIGAQIAKSLAAAGAAVVVNYASSREGAEAVVGEIVAQGGRAQAIQGDISNPSDVERLFTETVNAFGRPDILVNNAGVYEFAALEEITAEHFHRQFNLNVLGLLYASKAAAQHFGNDGGSIINISSVASRGTLAGASVYSATKASVDAITSTLARELGPRGIRVNSINPGMVETEGTHAQGIPDSDFRKAFESEAPLGRIGQPEDIAPAVVFLASEQASWVTGEKWSIAGGW